MEVSNDKFSIKNMLFTKALPNYVIPTPVNGHKVFTCTDCGDKFVFESSFKDHISRKSMKISYMCRYCNQFRIFYNRCNLLFHIRSHVFKTATINVTDLKIEPLPLSFYKKQNDIKKPPPPSLDPAPPPVVVTPNTGGDKITQIQTTLSPTRPYCFECKSNLTQTGIGYKDRATHFMQYTNEVYSCPVCLFALPSICALKTHLRLHLRCPPFFCPECGIEMTAKNINYPYHHDCEGFKMMRATARISCSTGKCRPYHPNDLKDHMIEFHMKKVYKCPICVVACFNSKTMHSHLKTHKTTAATKALIFYQCELCPGKFVLQNHTDVLLKNHVTVSQYPCWPCGANFKDVAALLYHFKRKHNKHDLIRNALTNILSEYEMFSSKPRKIYRVVKRCDQCERDFTYKCRYEGIHNLPNECPFQCSSNMEVHRLDVRVDKANSNKITCHLCKMIISQDWAEIKKHYAVMHKEHKCLDPKIVLKKIDVQKYMSINKIPSKTNLKIIHRKIANKSKKYKRLRRNQSFIEIVDVSAASNTQDLNKEFVCNMCGDISENKLALEKHMLFHKDPCMAYQCMECGQSFVVKPSFSKHLLLEHGIKDTEKYITTKQCYNENALMKYQKDIVTSLEPLGENQCKICREEFENPEDLEKHFRVHGMAFLMKNTSNKTQTIS
ncbi:unnamed protein product [Chrysodeixis includens]|uniref:C2H2-type domain-containing protein n=2 Tax=Chrysodeixis includens TaxID=689277 RepID=A0A9P0BR29_CHRIL|nr:unnamed protein product [Chrysodeixis includens]